MEESHTSNNTTQAFWIAIGSLFSFLFTLVSSAILSRYLTKDDYGTYKQVMYVYHTLLSVFTLGLPLAYSFFLPRVSLAEGKALTNKLNGVFFILGFFFSITLYLSADLVSEILNNKELSKTIRIFSPSPIFMLPTMGLQGVLATYKMTILNAAYVVISRFFMLFCVVLPVCLISADVKMALWGFVVSSFISMVVAFYIMRIPFRDVKIKHTNISYKEIFNYSLPLMIAGLLGVAINASDQFYVSRYFGQRVFADFANGSLELPFVGMVLSACGTVLLPVFSRLICEDTPITEILDLWKRTAIKASYVLYPLIVFCMFFATDIMAFIYGSQYATSGIYFRIMLIANFFTVVQFYPIILALGKTKQYAIVHIIIFFLVWIGEGLVVWISDTAISVTVTSVIFKIMKIILLMSVISSSIGVKVWHLFPMSGLLKVALCCFFSGLSIFFLTRISILPNLQFLFLMIKFVTYSVVVWALGKRMGINYVSLILPVIKKYINRTFDK